VGGVQGIQHDHLGGGTEGTAPRRQAGNELRHRKFELADEHTAGGGHVEAGAVLAGGQRQCEVGNQQRLADLGFPSNEQYALRRQQSRFDPAGRRRGRLLGEQLGQRQHRRFGSAAHFFLRRAALSSWLSRTR
jgi:hypothetical protein